MNRTKARTAAMQLIYEWEMGGCGGIDSREGLLEITENEENAQYMDTLVNGVLQNAAEIDAKIASFLRSGWRLERLSRVDLCILRLAVYELLYAKEPAGIVINEAVELTHAYSTDEISAFVNGVLASVVRSAEAEKE